MEIKDMVLVWYREKLSWRSSKSLHYNNFMYFPSAPPSQYKTYIHVALRGEKQEERELCQEEKLLPFSYVVSKPIWLSGFILFFDLSHRPWQVPLIAQDKFQKS